MSKDYDPRAGFKEGDRDKTPAHYRNDLSNGPELALTKEQHDAIVEARGRSYTDREIVPRSGSNSTMAEPI